MQVFELYSKRKKKAERAEETDVYRYDLLPEPLREQIRRILVDAIGPFVGGPIGIGRIESRNNSLLWEEIRSSLTREKGQITLSGETYAYKDLTEYLYRAEVDDCLDLIEFSFFAVDQVVREYSESVAFNHGITISPDEAIDELNHRFREAGVGYQFQNGQIIKVDSQFVHSEVVKPALQLLSDPRFEGAEDEVLAAHAHYRAGEHKDCVVDALNAFESTMKAICDAKGWEFGKGAGASALIKILRANGLLPDYLERSFDQLAATLKSGLPAVRNEGGGHGQGSKPKETPHYVSAFALHLTASNIVFLVEAFHDSE